MEIENLKLQKQIDELIDKIYPVGSYYETSNSSFDPNDEWGGVWNNTDSMGYVTVGASSGSMNDQVVILEVGSTTGEVSHVLTQAEMPAHLHSTETLAWTSSGGFWIGSGNGTTVDFSNIESSATGQQQAHNNVQPSLGVWRWHRTA